MTSKKKRRNNKNKASRTAATVQDNATASRPENGGVKVEEKEPIACQSLTLEELKLRIKASSESSEIRKNYEECRAKAAGILNPKDCEEVALDYIECGKDIDSKRLAKKMPHTAQDLKEGKIDCNKFLSKVDKLYDLKQDISGMNRPLLSVTSGAVPKGSPDSGRSAYEFYNELNFRAVNMREESSKQTLAECLKFATDATCEAQAKSLDQAMFGSKRGSYLKSSLVYKLPVRYFESLLSDQMAESGFRFATLAELEAMQQEADSWKRQLRRAVNGIGLNNFQDMKRSCWECERIPTTLLTCSSCGVANYCGEDCQREAWRTGHKLKCSALGHRHSLQQISLKVFQDAHISSHVGLRLNKNKDYEAYLMSFRNPPLTPCWGSVWLLHGPSMETYYENLRRIHGGDFWIWKDPDTMEEYSRKLKPVLKGDQEEEERKMMRNILDYLCYNFEHSETGELAASSEDDPHSSYANKLSMKYDGLAMPVERFFELYCSDSFSLDPEGGNATPWQRKKEAEYAFRKWAHK